MPSTTADDDGNRGTGRTTRQIKAAREGALFIAPNAYAARYTKRLIFDLGRTDIKIVTLEDASRNGWERTYGKRGRNAVVLDHACWGFMSPEQRETFSDFQHAYEW